MILALEAARWCNSIGYVVGGACEDQTIKFYQSLLAFYITGGCILPLTTRIKPTFAWLRCALGVAFEGVHDPSRLPHSGRPTSPLSW
jgi:hypothetical protein